jgi:cell division protein FtsI/penicillin-binding protein 2
MDALKMNVRSGVSILVLAALVVTGMSNSRLLATDQTGKTSDKSFAHTASLKLDREFPQADTAYLFYDLRQATKIAERWESSEKAIPVGSLVKPFTAIAYAEGHEFRFPEYECSGGSSCWRPQGHGVLGIVRATALSCNSYFTQLAEATTPTQVVDVAHRFGLDGPGATATPEAMAGKHGTWRESPDSMVRAYAELLARRSQPGIRDVLEGMEESAKHGTASGIARSVPRLQVLAKTGTAPCTHTQHAPGDGFALVAWPADSPHYLMLVRVHGKPGAQAAVLAGQILKALEPTP